MYPELSNRVRQLIDHPPARLSGRRIGLEKETLRIDSQGTIALTDHPADLGSALCNSQITTDFSESLLEMVTPPCNSAADALQYLTGLHQFILQRLPEGESLWNTSMPCVLNGDDSIRIGQYGTSHNGMMKQIYRRGLGLRYGRRMQAIAGIHFNFSLPETAWPLWQGLHGGRKPGNTVNLVTDGYFHMTRNLMRIGWLVPYLFGASPAICQTFLPSGADSDLETLNGSTRFAPLGTSLRMGEIGYRYKEDAPIDLSVRHCSFDHYLSDIHSHVTTRHPPYVKAGLRDENGEYQQLSTCKLQIENEYYSSVRPKQIPEPGEMPILALQRRGIRYLELRSVDVNVFDRAGMHLEQVAMLELLMLFAWLSDSEPLSQQEMADNKYNVQTVAHRGREPGLTLLRNSTHVDMVTWGKQVLGAMEPVAQWLDGGSGDTLYEDALQAQIAKLDDSTLTPSARVIGELPDHGSFFELVMSRSRRHRLDLLASPLDQALQQSLQQMVDESVQRQAQMEAACDGDFDGFLAAYFSQLNDQQVGLA